MNRAFLEILVISSFIWVALLQNMPRPRGADAAGLLLRELELHPPAEEWHRKNMFGGPWSDPEDMGADDILRLNTSIDLLDRTSSENCDVYYGAHGLWPRKRRISERDAAFGLNTSVGLGAYLGIMGSRRDVVTAVWKTGLEGVWYKVSNLYGSCIKKRKEKNRTYLKLFSLSRSFLSFRLK